MQKYFKIAGYILLGGFALVGFVFTVVFIGMQFGVFNVKGSISARNALFLKNVDSSVAQKIVENQVPCDDVTIKQCDWKNTPQWEVVKQGLIKDQVLISRGAAVQIKYRG